MEQRKSIPEGQSGAPLPAWMQRTASYSPDRRAKMLEHMARARSVPPAQVAQARPAKAQVARAQVARAQVAEVTEPSRMSGWDILRDAYVCAVLSAIIAFIFQSRVPFYLGAFMFLTDGERIESALGRVGIRFEPGAIGPDIVKGFISLFGWFALLASLRSSAPAWLATWMPPTDPSWSFIAGIALAFVILETLATRAMRRGLPWFGWDNLTWKIGKLALAIGALALLVLLRAL